MKLRDLFSDDATLPPQAEAVVVVGCLRWTAARSSRATCSSRSPAARPMARASSMRRSLPARWRSRAIIRRLMASACPSSSRRTRAARWRSPRRNSYPRQPADHRGGHRHQRQDLGGRLHAADLAAARSRIGQHRHHRAGVAEAHRLRLADDAGSDCAASPARRNRGRRRHPSGLRGLVARARSVPARRRADRRRRLHQSLARPHGLPSRRRALPQRQAAAVPRSGRGRWRRGDLGRS